MKKKYQLSFQKIRRKTQIKDIISFEIYLKNIFTDLAKRDWSDREGKGVEKITFIEFMNLPFIVGEKLFNVLDKNRNGFLSKNEFISGIINLYVGGLEETQKVIFNMLDFDFDGKIIPEDSRLLMMFIKNLANPPQKVMKVKPREAPTDEENLQDINLIIKNFFDSKRELTFEEFKYNIENVNSDVFFLFICFLYNNKPFNDSSIKILKLRHQNSHLASSASSNYISCSSDDCSKDSVYKIKTPSNAFKSFIFDLVDMDVEEIERECSENSADEQENVDEGMDDNLICEGSNGVSLPQLKPNINLNQLKGHKDYLLNAEVNKKAMATPRIRKTYENYIERVNKNGGRSRSKDKENFIDNANLNSKGNGTESKFKARVSEIKKYLNEAEDDLDGNKTVNNVDGVFTLVKKKSEDENYNIINTESSKMNKSQTMQQLPLPSVDKLIITWEAENTPKVNEFSRNQSDTNFPKIEILSNYNHKINKSNNNPVQQQPQKYDFNSNGKEFTSLSTTLKQSLPPNYDFNSNILSPMGYDALDGKTPNNNNDANEEVLITDVIYENYIFKSRNSNKLKKYYLVLVGKDLFYFSNSKKKSLRGMHNLSGTYIFEDENVIKVREEKENPINDNINNNTSSNYNNKSEENTVLYYPFKLYFKKKSRVYYCRNEAEAKTWVAHIRNVTKFRLINDFYNLGEELGSGKYGKVSVGFNKTCKKKCAIKAIDKTKLKGIEFGMVKTEIEIMKFCQHKNIVRLIDHFEDMDKIYIVLEYLSGGNLNYFLLQQKALLSEERIKSLLNQMASGVAYLHNFGIIHRDLKPENTMMSDASANAIIKIVDFGLSKILGINEKSNEAYGTLSYAAPEVIQKKDYTNKIDIWSLGVIMYFLISGYLPFYDKNNNSTIIANGITKGAVKFDSNIWVRISKEGKDLVMRCLEKDISKRLNINEFIEHVWFKEH